MFHASHAYTEIYVLPTEHRNYRYECWIYKNPPAHINLSVDLQLLFMLHWSKSGFRFIIIILKSFSFVQNQ